MPNRRRISTCLAEWSQVVSALLAIAGLLVAYHVYIHTVVPIWQRDRVEEDKAHLEILNEDATTQLQNTNQMLVFAKGGLSAANESVAEKDGEVAKLQSKSEWLEQRQRVLVEAQHRLLATEFASAVEDVRRDRTSDIPSGTIWPDAVSVEEKIWPHPFSDLSRAVDGLETRDRTRGFYAPETFPRLRQVLDRKRKALVCTPIDFDAKRVEHAKRQDELRSASSSAHMNFSFQSNLETLRSECEKVEGTFVDWLSHEGL
jgi:hypothetical protein